MGQCGTKRARTYSRKLRMKKKLLFDQQPTTKQIDTKMGDMRLFLDFAFIIVMIFFAFLSNNAVR